MASRKIILKKNSLSGSIPSSSELSVGELAINTADGIIYTKLNDGTIIAPVGGVGGGDTTVSWNSITNKPSVFTPSVHNHNISDITDLAGILTAQADAATTKSDAAQNYAIQRINHTGTQPSSSISDFASAVSTASPVKSVAGKTGIIVLTKQDVGLNNVNNTSDLNKPISNATQNALNLKANINNPTFTGTVSGITKNMVGLSNVDNTGDLEKPISTAQAAINTLLQNDSTTKANNAQSYAIQRSNHTGTQPISTIDQLEIVLSSKSPMYHTHGISGINNNIIGVTSIGSNALEYMRNSNISSEYIENYSTGIGIDALEDSYGLNNTAIGAKSLKLNTNGRDNTCIGFNSASSNISGPRNIAIGSNSAQNLTTGGGNVSVGFGGMPVLTTGLANISIGSGGLDGLTVGIDNIALGRFTSVDNGDINSCIILGAYAKALDSGELVIGSPERPIKTSLTVGPPGGSNVAFLPSKPLGYLFVRLNSGLVRIPFYN